jgi:hypothetical protein
MARSKKKIDIAPEDMDVAKNLGVNTEEKPKVDKGLERKKYKAAREAMLIGGALKPEERAAMAEKRRYHRTLATGALLSGVTGKEIMAEKESAIKESKAKEAERSQQFVDTVPAVGPVTAEGEEPRTSRALLPKGKLGTPKLEPDELKAIGKKELAKSATSNNPLKLPNERFLRPKSLGTLNITDELEREPEPITATVGSTPRKADNAAEGQRATEAAVGVTKAKAKSKLVGKPQFDPMAASAKMRPADKGLASSVYDYMENPAERAASSLEKARPKIAQVTGKAPESISYSGDEPYDVKDPAGNVVATRTVNSHALSLAQKSHREAKRTGKEVNGIKPTDKRPSKVEDIIGTPHQAMAFQLRHLPALTEKDVMGAPGLDREKFKVKSEALMTAAVNKAESTRKIPVANEVQKGHKGWEDEKGIVHPFVFEKGGKVSPLSLPDDFTRTAQPKVMLHIPDEEDTETSMGAAQVAEKAEEPVQRLSKSGMVGAMASHEPSAVASHEGWTLHDDNVWRKIEHPLARIPDEQKMHAADYVAAQASMLVEDKKSAAAAAKKKPKSGKKAVGEIAQALAKEPESLTNPRAPKTTTNKMLVRDVKAITKALKGGKITQEQAGTYSSKFLPKPNMGELITTPKPGGFNYLSKEEKKSLKRTDLIAYNKSVREHEAKLKTESVKRQQKALSPNKSFYNRYVDVKPVGKVESSKFTAAKADVTAGRQFRTIENKPFMNISTNEHNLDAIPAESIAGVKPRSQAVKSALKAGKIHPEEAAELSKGFTADDVKKEVAARGGGLVRVLNPNKTTKILSDTRGPVRDTEVYAHMQHLPEKSDVTTAVKAGKLHPEEAKELRTLDQFSKYRAEGVTRGEEGLKSMKYSTVYEPQFAPLKTEKIKGTTSISKLNEAIVPGVRKTVVNTTTAPRKDFTTPEGKKVTKVPKSMKRVYGEKLDVPEVKPENRGMKGSASEGRGRQFSSYSGPLNLNMVNPKTGTFQGTAAVHPTLGRGYVAAYHETGTAIPGTGKKVLRGSTTKETVIKGAKKFEAPHVTFVPQSDPANPIHVPASDFQ